jgi:hypothetical protein
VTNPDEPSVVVPTGPATITAVNVAGASSVAIGQALIEVASITVSAGSQPASVTGVNLTRTGLSPDTAISGITVWNGTQRLNVSNILAYGVADINFSNAVVIPANTSVTLSVKVNVDSKKTSATPGSQFAITVNEVKNAAASTLIPATSGIKTVTDVQLGVLNVSISGDAPTSALDVGVEGVPLAKFNLEATGEDLLLKQVGFSQNGNAADADIANLKLFNNSGVQVGSEAIRNGRLVSFTFADGLAIENGTTQRLELRGDVVGGSARQIQFGVDDATDIQATGKTYGTTIVSTLSTAPFATKYTVETGYPLDINPGSFVVSKAETSPVAGDVGYSFKENVFTILRVEAIGEPIQVRTVKLAREDGGSNLAVGKLANLKLLYNGSSIAQVVKPFNDNPEEMEVTLTAPITLNPGTPAYISIAADTNGTLLPADVNKTIVLGLSGEGSAIYGLGTVSAKNIYSKSIGSPVYGSIMTVGDVQVKAVAVPRGGTDIFAGQVNAELSSFTLDHNLSETVSVTKLGVTVPTTFVGGVFTNIAIYDDQGVAISDRTVNVSDAGLNFTLKTPLKIEPGTSVRVVLRADVSSTAVAAAATISDSGFAINASGTGNFASYAITTALGTDVPVKGATSSTTYTVSDGAGAGIHVTASQAVSLDDDINAAQGATNVAVGAFQFENTGREPVLVKKLYLKGTFDRTDDAFGARGAGTADDLGTSNIRNITIINNYDKSILGKAEYLAAGTDITLTTPLYLGNGSATKYADIVVQVDVISTAKRGGTFQVELGGNTAVGGHDYEIQTQSTGKTVTDSLLPALPGSLLVVTPSTVSVTANSVSSVTNSTGFPVVGNTIGSFTFTNNGSVAVVVDQVDLSDALGASTPWNQYVGVQLVKGSTILNGSVHVGDGGATDGHSANLGGPIQLNSPSYLLGSPSTSTGEQLRLEAGASVTVTVRVSFVDNANFSLANTPEKAETSVALKVARDDYDQTGAVKGTTFIVPNDSPIKYLIEDDAASAVVYYIKN